MPSRAHAPLDPARPVIFVVDDDDVVRESVTVFLETRRYTVREFSSGQALLERVNDGDAAADCLLLDINMPAMNGIEVVQALRRRGDATPVIFMSGAANRATFARALAMGVPLLEKPIPPAALVTAIERVLGHGQGDLPA